MAQSVKWRFCPRKREALLSEGFVSRLGQILPESDAHQNSYPLFYEFSFGILNMRKGQKHLIPGDDYRAA
jgi:hypothetical protein